MTAREQAADVDVAALRELLDDGRCLCSSAHTDWRGVAALLDRLERAEAAVARVDGFVAQLVEDGWKPGAYIAADLRAALGGDQ